MADAKPSAKAPVTQGRPPLISKLRYVEDQTVSWRLKPGFLNVNGAVPMDYQDTNRLRNKAGAAEPVEPGETFFRDGPAKGRFKYLGRIQRKEMNPAINMEERVAYVRIQDLQPNKAGKVYEIPAPLRNSAIPNHIQHDRSAVLVLMALGQGDNLMFIEENTSFSLPFGQEEEPYLLKSVSPEEVLVEWLEEGETKQLKIKKGALPQ